MSAISAAPRFDVGDVVTYRDRQDRVQTGEVAAVEASWRWGRARTPLIVYTLRHPTYSGRRFYTTDERIFGFSNAEPQPESPSHDRI